MNNTFDNDHFLRLTEGLEDVPKHSTFSFSAVVAAIHSGDAAELARCLGTVNDSDIYLLKRIHDDMFRPFMYEKNAEICAVLLEFMKKSETVFEDFAVALYEKTCLLEFSDGTGEFVLGQIVPHAKIACIKQIAMQAGYSGQENDILFLLKDNQTERGLAKNLSSFLVRAMRLRSEAIAEAVETKISGEKYKVLADMVGCQCKTISDLRFLVTVSQQNPRIHEAIMTGDYTVFRACVENEHIAKALMSQKDTQSFFYPHVTLQQMTYLLTTLPVGMREQLFEARRDLWNTIGAAKATDFLLGVAEKGDIPLLRIVLKENPDLLLLKHKKGQLKGHSLLSLTKPTAKEVISRELLNLGLSADTKNDPSKNTQKTRKL